MDTEDIESKELTENLDENVEDKEMDQQNLDMDYQNELSDLDEEEAENEETKLNEQIKEAKDKVSLNPYDYDGHLELIRLYQIAGEFDELRLARQHMSNIYPLTPTLWLEWLQDEIKFKESDDDNLRILKLFERAIDDYLSVEIWLEYEQFAIGLQSESNVDIIKIFEQAITNAGLHPVKGHKVYEIYRLYEQMLVDFEDDKEKQLKKVLNLFKRQLSIPNVELDNTYKEFQDWIISLNESHPNIKFDCSNFENLYKKSKEQMNQILPFENKLNCEKPDLNSYNEYLDYEIKQKNPNRVKFLFERAITDHCLVSDLWIRYLKYLQEHLNFYDLIVSVLKRSVRNVTWCVELWIEYIKTIERFDRPEQEAQEIFEKALSSQFQQEDDYRKLWLCYLEFKRRKTDFNDLKQIDLLRKNFETAVQHLNKMYNADPYFTVSIFQAKVEAKYCSNIIKSREIWETIMDHHKDLGDKQVNYWLEYAELEKLYGNQEIYKKIMLKALNYCPENYDLLSVQLIRYFKEESNSIKEIDAVEKSILNIYERVVKKFREKQEEKQKESKSLKRKDESISKPDSKSNKRTKFEAPTSRSSNSTKSNEIVYSKKPENDDYKLNTVAVKNLCFSLTEERIKEEFSKFGTVKEVRLVRDAKGKSRGFCFVEFTSIEAAKNAIKNDGMMINTEIRDKIKVGFKTVSRPALISEIDKNPEFRYKTDLERNKLFVSKLDPKVTQDQLIEIYSKFNGFEAARLGIKRNGETKCIAYIDFKTDRDAARALQETDGIEIGKKKIKVELSNPPKKKEDKNDSEELVKRTLGNAVFKKPILG